MTPAGLKTLHSMEKQYGADKGKRVFYASENKGIAGSEKWTKKKEPRPGLAGLRD